jgi:hypothetical protein
MPVSRQVADVLLRTQKEGMQALAGGALAVDVRRERVRGDAAESTNVNGLDLAFGEQLVQEASSDPEPLRRFRDGEEQPLFWRPGRTRRVPLGSTTSTGSKHFYSGDLACGTSHVFSSVTPARRSGAA